jgi:hypothetical protein
MSYHGLTFEPEANLDGDLEFSLAASDGSTNLLYLEPIDIANGLASLGDSIADRLLDTFRRNAYYLYNLVCLLRHRSLLRKRGDLSFSRVRPHPATLSEDQGAAESTS